LPFFESGYLIATIIGLRPGGEIGMSRVYFN